MSTLNITQEQQSIDLNRTSTLLGIGVALFVAQFLIVLSTVNFPGPYNLEGMWITIPDYANRLSDTNDMLDRVYSRLNGWDGHWYHHIAANGYQCSDITRGNNPQLCNVAFFPLLPMLGAALASLGIDLMYALPLVSQAAWLATILLLLLFARSLGGLQPLHVLLLLTLIAYPGALYGFVAYTESLLTLLVVAIAALAYWYLDNPRPGLLAGLAASCFLLGLLKVSGVVALAIPVLMALLHPSAGGRWFTRRQTLVYAAATAGLAGLGAFLLYCELRFGDWALYFRYVSAGWSGADAKGISFNPLLAFAGFSWHDDLSLRISNLVVVALPPAMLALGVLAWRFAADNRHLAVALLATLLVLFYFYTTPGNSGMLVNMNIMRHMLPVVALLVMLAMSLPLARLPQKALVAVSTGLFLLVMLEFYNQVQIFQAFRFGNWVS